MKLTDEFNDDVSDSLNRLKGFHEISIDDLGTDNNDLINRAAMLLGFDISRVLGSGSDPKKISVRSRHEEENTPEELSRKLKDTVIQIQNEEK